MLEVDATSAPAISSTPRSSIAPIVGVPQSSTPGVPETFTVPRTDPDGDPTQCRLSTDAEAGGGSSPAGITVNSDCTVDWDNANLTPPSSGLYTMQVIIEELDGSGNVTQTTPVDFILSLGGQSANNPPVCEITDAGGNDVTGGTLIATVGSTLDFTVTGTDADGDDVEIAGVTVPAWGTMTPGLPTTSPSPVTSSFSGTPAAGDVGTEFATYSLSDPSGAQTQCTVTIDVVQAPTCAPSQLTSEVFNNVDRRVEIVIEDPEGITTADFMLLDNLVEQLVSATNAGGSVGFSETSPDVWTADDPNDLPTRIEFYLNQDDVNNNNAGYYVEVENDCGTTTTIDPPVEFTRLDASASVFALEGAYPNPSHGQTTLSFSLAEQAPVTLAVYDVMGRKVATLVDGAKSAGVHTATWDGRTESGQRLASGLYLVRLQAGDQVATQRLTIVR